MQHLEFSGAVRHIYIVRQLRVNVTSLLTVQLACNNTEMISPLHPELIRSFPTPSIQYQQVPFRQTV
jgi:hypothetical protein